MEHYDNYPMDDFAMDLLWTMDSRKKLSFSVLGAIFKIFSKIQQPKWRKVVGLVLDVCHNTSYLFE